MSGARTTAERPRVGLALCGSFCTLARVLEAVEPLRERCALLPILSQAVATCDTRFGTAQSFRARVEALCGCRALTQLQEVEPLGPKRLLDALIVAPCTGNTLGKLAAGIADSAVTFAVKAHLRNGRPVLLAVSSNDALAGSAENLGRLLNRRNYYFVPFGQDDPVAKPASLVADFHALPQALEAALEGRQLQPLLRGAAGDFLA